MAKITVPETGGRAPVLTGSRVGRGAFDNTNAEAVGALASQAVSTVVSIRNQEKHDAQVIANKEVQEAEQRHREAKRAKSVESYAGFQADLDEFTDSLTGKLAAKGVTRDKLPEEFDKGLADLKKKRLEGLDPEQQNSIGAHFMVAERSARGNLRKAVEIDIKQERVASISGALEEFQRLAVKDPAKAIGQANMLLDAEGPGVLGADKVAAHKQQFAERAYASHFTNRLNAVRNDARGLAQLEADIAKTDTLDPDKANILLGRVIGMRETIAAKAERAQASRLRTVQSEITKLNTLTMQGYDPTLEQMLPVQQAAKGTELEGAVRQMVAFTNESAKFRAMPPSQQETYINDLEARVRKNPSTETAQFVEKLKTIGKAQREAIATDSLSFAEQRGVAAVTSINLADALTNPAALKDQFLSRLSVARGVQAKYGGPLHVLKKEEAEALPGLLNGLAPPQKAAALKAIGGLVGDPVAMRDLAAQVKTKDQGLATAMFLASKELQTTTGRNVAEMYLLGQDALQNKRAKIDDKAETGMRAEITTALDGVYATTTARDMAVDVSMKLWASGRVMDNGLDNVTRAVDVATGGVMTHNGGKVAKPYGWADNRFVGALGAFNADTLKQQSGSDVFMVGGQEIKADALAKSLPKARLQTVGDGRYAVISGSDYVRTPDRKPLVIEVR